MEGFSIASLSLKKNISELAIFGGKQIFEQVKSTANLPKPDQENFFKYAKKIYENRRITNNGPLVIELERRLEELHQTKYCIATCNGFSALMIAIKALAIEGKKEVIMPSLAYRRLSSVPYWVNLTPHFCDIDLQTMAMKPEFVEPLINENTALILASHSIINLSDIHGLEDLAKKYNIPILFDSVEAVYAKYKGKMIGGFGDAEIFSMHASKLVSSFEGGYITTNNQKLAENLELMRGFGFQSPDNIQTFGLNAKLNEVHAAFGLAVLDDLKTQIVANKKRYYAYKNLLQNIEGLDLVEYDENEQRSFKSIVVKINDKWPFNRDYTIKLMRAENMFSIAYYSPPLHLKKTEYEVKIADMNNTIKLMDNHMLLPCGEFVDETDVNKIVGFLKFIEINSDKIKIDYEKAFK